MKNAILAQKCNRKCFIFLHFWALRARKLFEFWALRAQNSLIFFTFCDGWNFATKKSIFCSIFPIRMTKRWKKACFRFSGSPLWSWPCSYDVTGKSCDAVVGSCYFCCGLHPIPLWRPMIIHLWMIMISSIYSVPLPPIPDRLFPLRNLMATWRHSQNYCLGWGGIQQQNHPTELRGVLRQSGKMENSISRLQ